MAKETKTKKRTKKKNEVTYRDQKYLLLEEAHGKCKLTDGTIHFWAREEEVDKGN